MVLLVCALAVCLSAHGAIPTITQQPQRTNVVVGDNAVFEVVASGTAPLAYQWRMAGTNLPNRTNATLFLTNVQSSQAGGYQVVVSNAEGSATSIVAQLTVRPPNTSIYLPPPGGWTYRYDGDAMATLGAAALDGTWNHDNGSDAWAGDLRGVNNLPPGGLSVSNGILTLEDVVVSGGGNDNRRLYFTHVLSQDTVTNANTILNDGVTFTFRTRLTPPTDPLVELTNAPNGFINVADGKGMIGIRQSGSSGMIISFSLNMASEDTNATTLYDFPAAGLHMNNLNGNLRTDRVDPGETGTVNVFPVNPAEFHEFWITVQDNGADPGTHRVSVYADGSTNAAVFNVTAGIGVDTPITNYLAIGMPSAVQRGAFDLDWVGYKQGVHVPQQADVPVEIVAQPANQTVNEGQSATFSVSATGTPPITYQWTRDGTNIPGATDASYTTGSLLPPDSGAVFRVQCQNAAGSALSDPATVTVITDTNPPTLVSASSLNGQSIGLCFNERVTAASAQSNANYIVNNGVVTVTSATLRSNANNTTVLLQVTGLSSQAGTVFTVRATNIFDASFTGNRGGGTVQGVVHGLTATNIGPANGATFTCASNRFEMSTDGAGLAGTADTFHFASMGRTNDFDVRVRLAQLTGTNVNGQAGLVARVDQTAGSRTINAFVTPLPGDNAYHATYRSSSGGATAAWPGGSDKTGVPLPNAWVRLTRAGDIFTAYHGTNGTDWQSYAQVTQSLPATLLVGIAGANLADSVMDELIFIPPPTIITPPTNMVATNGDTVTFSVVATSRAEIGFQWRLNGTNLPNQTNATLVLANVTPSQAGTYDVRVFNGGGAVVSAPASLIVRTLDYGDAPPPYATLLANNGARHVIVSGIRLGATVDFELDGAPSAGANGDDVTGSDDEDGVNFTSPLWVDQTATVEVVASTNGVLNAWIDFGADGTFAQPQDQVFANYPLEPGTNLLSLIVPFDAVGTNTFARFRFSTVGGLAPTGIAPDGEVEDYAVTIIPVADLSVVATDSPDPVAVGSNLTYQVTIRNVGPAIATQVTVTNRFSTAVDFVSAVSTRGSCVNNAGIINCAIGELGLSSNATITIAVRAQTSGTLTSTFGIFADQPDPNTGDNIAVGSTTVELAPTITVPPASLTVTQHNTATFSVTAGGTAPLRYQWFFNSAELTNRTNATLTITDAQSTNQGNYQVRITNRVGGVLSPVVTLTVLDPPVISQQPQSRTNLAGSTATLTVVAQGTAPLAYQWFLNGTTALSGETNSSLTLTNVQKSQAGTYSVRVSNSAGVLDSAGAVLTVIEMDFGDAPTPFATLLAQNGARHRIVPGFYLGASVDFEPDGQADDATDEDGVVFRNGLLLGQSARIEVVASSNGVLNAWLDWNGNGSWADTGEKIFSDQALTAGTNVLSATVPLNAQLGLRAARFRFSTATGLSFTNEALNGEVEDYQVTVQPAVDLRLGVTANPVTVRLGSNVVYTIGVTNGGPSVASGVIVTSSLPASVTVISIPAACINQNSVISCNLGSFASGASSNLTVTVRPNQTGDVTNIVTVSCVEPDSNPTNNVAQLVVSALEFPAITGQPQNVTIVNGDAASFQVTATGTALRYQWIFNSGDITNATNSTLVINPAAPANEGTYRVRVSNALGQVVSDPAQLTVLVPPSITTHPTNRTVNAGATASFTVVAAGTAPLSYQWSFGGIDLAGQTSATLTLANVGSTNEGSYRVRVSNAAGTAFSDAATLTVLVGVGITQQPQSKTVFAGSQATLQVVATGTEPINYQWFLNGATKLNGATNSTLVLSNVQVSQTGPYTVFVSNRVSSITSAAAQLTVREADFGDAQGPSYATLLVFNGAYHYISPGVYLGSRVDFEPDGQPAANASGDDLAGQDDEDGVSFVLPLLVGQQGRVNVTASTNGFLDAWIDFNGNGDWTDLGEQVFASRALSAGNNSLTFAIPPSALAHGALARFRFSTTGGLLFSGGANDGEVEDHVATITPAVDLAVTLIDQPDPVLVGSNLHLFVTITNPGPSTATGVTFREYLPISATFLSASLSQGSYTNESGTLVCDIGSIPAHSFVTAEITLLPQGIGVAGHRAEVTSAEQDLNTTNNVATQLTTVVTAVGPFTNATYIAINDFGPASVYPSTITVSGVTGTVHQVIVTLNNLSHVFPDDLDMLLVGPRGQKVIIMSDAGGANDPGYITFSLDDSSDLILPDEGLIIDEIYRPADYDPSGDSDVFDAPAPPGPYTNRLAAFKGSDANGVWSLYIMDDFAQDNGELVGGWSLDFLVLDPISDGSVNIAAAPSPAGLGQNVTYTLTVSNSGPSAVSSMLLTNVFPTNALLQSFVPSQGQCTNVAGAITCDFGTMEGGAAATLTVVVTPQQIGVLSNFARVTPSQLDLNQTNNTASLITPVRFFADVSLAMTDSQDPVPAGQAFNYTLTVSNRGPQLAQAVVLTNPLPADFTFTGVTTTHGSCTNQSGVLSCALGDLAVGSSATIQITGQGTRIGLIANSASVQGNVVDGDLTNNQRTEETVVVFAAPAAANTNGITVPNPYPSTIQVSGLTGAVYKVVVTISNLTHATPESLQLLLVGPSGQNVMLMNAVGGNNAISGRTLRLDDQAGAPLPDSATVTSGTYRPASYSTPSSLPAPAPAAPYGNVLTVFRGTEGNGTWSLFTRGGGTIGAWWLEIFTMEPVADLSVNVVSQPTAVSVGSNLTYIVTVSNRGPATASGIALTNVLPASFSVTSATGCTNICNIGSLSAGAQLQFRVDGVALAEGSATNRVSALAVERDLNTSNNTAVAVTVMKNPPVFTSQPQNVTVTNGDVAQFSVSVSGVGPFTYQWLRNGNPVSGGTASTLVISNAQQADAGLYAVRVSDGVGSPLSGSARLTVLNRPTITDITNVTILEDTASPDLPFTISDFESSVLTLEVNSSNPILVPISNVFISGTGDNRTVKISPTTNQFGFATITITVRDSDGISASDSFDVTVISVNDLPVLGAIGNQVMDEDTQRNISLQASDVEDTPAQLSLSAIVNDTNLLAAAIANRTLTLTALSNQFGSTRVTVFLTDSLGGTVSNAFDVTVNGINDPPTLNPIDPVFIDQKAGPTVVPLSGISGGPANEPQSVSVRAATANTNIVGNLRINYTSGPSGSVSFETVSNFTGITTITVTVDDGAASNHIASRTFGVSIGDTNDPPTISLIADQLVAEDSSVQVNFTVADEETAPNALVLEAVSSNTNLVRDASLAFSGTNAARALTIIPEAQASGFTFITISVRDELGITVTRSFRLEVSPVNDPPTLEVIPVIELAQNAPTQIIPLTQISAGAADEPHNLLITATSSNPSLIPDPILSYNNPNTSGTLTIQPSGGTGAAVITIIVNDRGASNNIIVRTLTVNISELNRPPVISRIFNQATPEDTPIDVPFTIFDPESPADTLAITASSANTALIRNETLQITGTGTNRSLRAVPTLNASGTATITITATDTNDASSTATFVLEVTAVNDAPVIGDIPDQQINEDSALGPLLFYVNDLETSANALVLSALSSNPTLVPQFRMSLLGSGTNRTIRIVPAQNRSGSAVISITVRDGEGRTASDSFVLTVQATNDAPVISSIPDQTINMNASVAIPFTINDLETDPDSLSLAVSSSNPAVLPLTNIVLSGSSANRSVLLTPVPNLTGTSTVSIIVTDAQGLSASTSFAVQVTAGSGQPVVTTQPESLTVTNGTMATFSVTASGAPTLRYRWRFNGTNLPLATNFIYVITNARPSDAGPYTVSVANSLGSTTSSVAILTVVTGGSTTPQINTIADQSTPEDVPLPVSLTLQDADTPGHFLVLSATSTNTVLVPPSNYFFDGIDFNRTLTILPAPNQFGTNLITVTVSDGVFNSTKSFVLRVTPVNDAPTLDRIPNVSALANSQVTVPLTGISPGAANETTTVNITAAHNNNAVLTNLAINYTPGSSTGTLSVNVLSNATGSATITVTAIDGGPATLRTFQIVVRPATNQVPVVTGLTNIVIAEDTSTGPISFTVTDPDGSAGQVTLSAFSANTNVVPANGISFAGTGSSRTMTITPVTNQFGTSLVTVTATDSSSGLSTTNFLVTVQSVNDLPVISGIPNQTIYEDLASAPIPIAVRDVETPAGVLVLTASSSNQGVIRNTNILFGGSGSNRVMVLKGNDGQTGSATITVTLADQNGGSVFTNFNVTLALTNDPPIISEFTNITVDVSTATGPIPFVVWDEETAPSSLSVSAIALDTVLVPPGSITLTGTSSNRTLNIQPAADRTGASTINVSVSDGNSSVTRSFVLRVIKPETNAPPTLDPLQDVFVDEDSTPVTVNLSGISAGFGEAGQIVAIAARSGNRDAVPDPTVSYANPSATGTLTLAPVPGTNGVTTITVTANDGKTNFSRVFNVTVRARPALSLIPDIITDEDVASPAISFSVSDAETPASNLVFTVTSSNPTVLPPANVSIGGLETNRTLTVIGAPNEFGHSVVTLTVTDSDGLSRSNSFVVIINPVNDPPTLDMISSIAMSEDQGSLTTNITGITAGAANEAQLLMLDVTSSNPAVVPVPAVSYASPQSTASLTFTPRPNAYGSANITVTVNDGQSSNQFVSRTFQVTVNAVDDLPTLNPIPDLVREYDAGPESVLLTGITSGGANENQTVTVTAASSNPVLVSNLNVSYTHPNSVGTLTLQHNFGVSGTATITVTVSDGPNSLGQSFLVTVNPAPSRLRVSPIASQTISEDTMAGPINFTIDDDAQPGVELSAVSSNPTLIRPSGISFGGSGTNRTISLVPETNQFGNAIITVTLRAGGMSASNSFQLTVNGVDDFPFFVQAITNIVMDEDTELEVPFMVDDLETPAGALVVAATPYNRALFPAGRIDWFWKGPRERSILFKPTPNLSGTSVVELRVRDQLFQRATNLFTVTVRAVNDLPTMSPIVDGTIREDTELDIGFLVADVESDVFSLMVTASSSDTNLFANETFEYVNNGANRLVRARPVQNRTGTSIITITVRDTDGGVISNSIAVSVSAVNDPPNISAINSASISAGQSTAQLPFVIGDVESAPDQLTLRAVSSNTNLAPISAVQFSGTGSNRFVRVTPTSTQTGFAAITVEVRDQEGAVAQTTFELLVNGTNGPPVIVGQPANQDLFVGDPFTLRVLATGPGPLSYQWQLNDADIPGATNSMFSAAAAGSGSRSYRVMVGNSNGTVTSQTALVRVYQPARIARITRVGNAVHLAFDSAVGQTYTIEYRDALASGTWQELETITGTGAEVTIIDPSAAGPSRFYRLRINLATPAPNLGEIPPQTTNEDEPIALSFALQSELLTTAASSDQALVPDANIVIHESGGTCTLTILPGTNQFGTNTIFLSVTDAEGTPITRDFLLTVNPINDLPTISGLSDQTLSEDGQKLISITFSDVETASDALLASVTSSDTNLFPQAGLSLAPNGTNRTLTLKPAPDQFGVAVVTITVTDGQGGTAMASFQVQVESVHDPPTLGVIRDAIVGEDAAVQRIALTEIGTGAANEVQPLNLTASLSNSNLLTNLTLEYVSPQSSGFLTFETVPNAFGSTTVTVVVDDGGLSNNIVSRSFLVTINPVNDPPTLQPIADRALMRDAPPQTVALSGISSGAANENQILTVVASNSNPALITNIVVSYTSPESTGILSFHVLSNVTGSAMLTVTVNDSGLSNNLVSQSFSVTVSAPPTIYLEAESGVISSPMVVAAASNAFNGRYIYTPNNNEGTASYPVNIPLAGTYTVWCRLIGSNDLSDSFFVSIDGGAEGIYDTSLAGWSADWLWSRVNSRGGSNPRLFTLTQGGHTLVFRGRDAETRLDALYITADQTFVPSGNPGPNMISEIASSETAATGVTPTRITRIARTGKIVEVSFSTVPTQLYTVEYNDALDPSLWQPLETLTGAGTNATVFDTRAITPNRFYRVRTW